jgi:DNA gyrase subunit A
VMARGIIAIAIEKSDDLIEAAITDGKQTIFLASREGMAIRFNEEYDAERGTGLRPMGRNAAGNKGISLKKGDQVIGVAVTISDETRDRNRDESPPSSASPTPHRAQKSSPRPKRRCKRRAKTDAMGSRKTRS